MLDKTVQLADRCSLTVSFHIVFTNCLVFIRRKIARFVLKLYVASLNIFCISCVIKKSCLVDIMHVVYALVLRKEHGVNSIRKLSVKAILFA